MAQTDVDLNSMEKILEQEENLKGPLIQINNFHRLIHTYVEQFVILSGVKQEMEIFGIHVIDIFAPITALRF